VVSLTQTEAQGGIKDGIDKGLAIVKQVIMDGWDYVKSGVSTSWEGVKGVGWGLYESGKGVCNTVGGQSRETFGSLFDTVGQATRDFGNYSVDTAKTLFGTGAHAFQNTWDGSGHVASRGLEGVEYVGKGCGSVVGGTLDGFTSGFTFGRNSKKNATPKGLNAAKHD